MITVLASLYVVHEMDDAEIEVNAYDASRVQTVGYLVALAETAGGKFFLCHNSYLNSSINVSIYHKPPSLACKAVPAAL